jgi:hypothetical protein
MAEYFSGKAKPLTEQFEFCFVATRMRLPLTQFSILGELGTEDGEVMKTSTNCETFAALALMCTVHKPETKHLFSDISHDIA